MKEKRGKEEVIRGGEKKKGEERWRGGWWGF